jgi:hypothetical protein
VTDISNSMVMVGVIEFVNVHGAGVAERREAVYDTGAGC